HFQTVFWIAVVPAFLSVLVLLVFVHEPDRSRDSRPARVPLSRRELARLGRPYWWVVVVAAVFTLARFSEAFLILRAQEAGLDLMWTPVVLVVMGFAYSLSAYPAGALSDRIDRMTVLAIGLLLLLAADLVLALAPGLVGLLIGVARWGFHMGFTQGIFGALVADNAPADLRGTAFGVFHLLTGLALLLASITAGLLWDLIGYQGTFLAGATFVLLTLTALHTLRTRART